ncbi:unnamed protein product (macronuclear) [Paramecium tetraurelia]|uniref:Uncharacterized protein n=1 Tax=Paramecium tetraurelia TaxID=5888 RepID=A0DMY7_PARTE|nr:uncharacterized protein GSPATT00018609001 [Paramecium tetraurelia]CAK84404.1 unnamed protein product [Paramecium tetraurelia]|eukprot:XP_001451801.1 hypothetical protein (macronuclear) [Paramecium tetraurelia strain d4-2]
MDNILALLTKKPIRCGKYSSQEALICDVNSSHQEQSQIKQKKIEQLKNQLQRLKQNFDNQSKQKMNISNIIDNTIQQLLQFKEWLQIKKYEEPWQEIIQMERDIYLNEDNIIKTMPILHFNEILLQHQLCILELASQSQAIQQQNFWMTQIHTLHETFIQKNNMILQLLKPKNQDNLEQSIEISEQDFSHSFGKKY